MIVLWNLCVNVTDRVLLIRAVSIVCNSKILLKALTCVERPVFLW